MWKMASSGMHLFDFLIFFLCLRVRLLEGWQSGWDGSDTGRYIYSIWPVVSFLTWSMHFDGDRVIISMINMMMANHSWDGSLSWKVPCA
jgi:hypothetical protein